MKLRLADWVSYLRILIGIVLFYFAWTEQRVVFVLLFLLAGITDLVDGMLARKMGRTVFGSKLDGWADSFISISSIVWIWILAPTVLLKMWPALAVFFIFELISRAYQFKKFKTLDSYHLLSIKLLTVLYYFFVVSAVLAGYVAGLWYAIIIVAVINHIERFIIIARSKKFVHDIKSAFLK